MENEPITIVYLPCANKEEAQRIAKAVLDERLATCVNIIPHMTSMYWWNDEIEEKQEVLLIVKTVQEKEEEIKTKVKELHSYETPAIVFLSAQAEAEYAAWIRSEIEKK